MFGAVLRNWRFTLSRGHAIEVSENVVAVVFPRILYESPFTDVDPMGFEGIFGKEQAIAIVAILDQIKKQAAA
jgi:hypothetical protein